MFIIDMLASIPGPKFLLYYAVYSFVVLAVAKYLHSFDKTSGLEHRLPQPSLFDAYEIIFLSGGAFGVLRSAVVSLHGKKAVRVASDGVGEYLAAVPEHPSAPLDELEKKLFDSVSAKRTSFSEVNSSSSHLYSVVVDHLRAAEEKFRQYGLILDAADEAYKLKVLMTSVAVLLAPGLTKLALGLYRGKNVFFLVLMLFVVFFIAMALMLPIDQSSPFRRSSLGARFLDKINGHFRWAADHARDRKAIPEGVTPAILVGLFGLGVLSSTPMADLGMKISPPPSSGGCSSSGCSSGSSGCSSSGCSSGCGGGGGCGGCGSD